MQDKFHIHSVSSSLRLHANKSVPTFFVVLFFFFFSSPVACTPRKVIRHMTSDFDECEIDLDMQNNQLSNRCAMTHAKIPQLFHSRLRG